MQKIKNALAKTKSHLHRTYTKGKQKIHHHKLTKGSGRTEDIFIMKKSTKIILALVLILFLLGIFSVGIKLLQTKAFLQQELIDAQEQEGIVEDLPEEMVEQEPDQPQERYGYENVGDARVLVPPKERYEAEKIIEQHKEIGIGGFSPVCQVTIRDREHDVVTAGQFLKEANQTYNATLEKMRGPRKALERAITKVKKNKVDLDIAVQNCQDFDAPIRE